MSVFQFYDDKLMRVATTIKNFDGSRAVGTMIDRDDDIYPHSNILVWKIPWTEEPGGQQSMGSQRMGCD